MKTKKNTPKSTSNFENKTSAAKNTTLMSTDPKPKSPLLDDEDDEFDIELDDGINDFEDFDELEDDD